MARNKHPEETVEKILTVSAKLFMEKGYEHTTLQDIIDDLGGLTKGAIYHHFKGKEEILLAIADRMGEQTEAWMQAIRDDPGLTGAEKLRRMFRASLGNSDQTDLFALAPNMLKNPELMAILLESMMEDVLPNYMEPVLREAVADGSIRTDYPEELGELLLLLSNVWLNPMIRPHWKRPTAAWSSMFSCCGAWAWICWIRSCWISGSNSAACPRSGFEQQKKLPDGAASFYHIYIPTKCMKKEDHMKRTENIAPQDAAACLWLLGWTLLAGGEREGRS